MYKTFWIPITIECASKTCGDKKTKKFCSFYGLTKFGTQPICLLFKEELFDDDDGWAMRCPDCLEIVGTETEEKESQAS
jgi:hypothetical protein